MTSILTPIQISNELVKHIFHEIEDPCCSNDEMQGSNYRLCTTILQTCKVSKFVYFHHLY